MAQKRDVKDQPKAPVSISKPKKRAQESDDGSSDEAPPSSIKKPRIEDFMPGKQKKKTANTSPVRQHSREISDNLKTNAEGDKFLDLGKQKRATIRSFKGIPLIDIREFYTSQDGDEKPGKKGISLTFEQWQTLKNNISELDDHFASIKK